MKTLYKLDELLIVNMVSGFCVAVPQVLRTCADFIENHGIVDGIYRLSGITSNIQRLRSDLTVHICVHYPQTPISICLTPTELVR